MRTVTKEQAQESRRRLLEWAEKGQAGRGGTLGDWIYKTKAQSALVDRKGIAGRAGVTVLDVSEQIEILDTPSLTPGAFQRKWWTPTEFPECPETMAGDALKLYLDRLKPGAIFSRNQYGESIVVEAAIGPDNILSVVCNTPTGVKHWAHAKIFVQAETFCHESGGTFFTRQGAMKNHCLAVGAPFDEYEGSIDDYC
jgi:hypothetical protein